MFSKLKLLLGIGVGAAQPFLWYAVGAIALVALTYHFVTVRAVRIEEQIAGDARCLSASLNIVAEMTEAHKQRERELRAELDRDRDAARALAAEAEQNTRERLEAELARLKEDGEAWTKETVREIQR